MKESAIDEFLKAYYTDKDGKLAPKGKEWLAKSKKEKIKKMKDLADNLKDEEKQKVVNSEAAKQCEKQAIKSGVFTGIIGASAAASRYAEYAAANTANSLTNSGLNAKQSAENLRTQHNIYGHKYSAVINNNTIQGFDDLDQIRNGDLFVPGEIKTFPGGGVIRSEDKLYTLSKQSRLDFENADRFENMGNKFSSLAGIFQSLSILLYTTMWGGIIAAGIGVVKTAIHAHKANTLRREEIMKQLMSSKRNLDEDFELAAIGVLLSEFYY